MAASQMIDKKEDNFSIHTGATGMKKSTVSTPTPRPSPSIRRFQEITKQIISMPTRRSSSGMHSNAPISLEAGSSRSGKDHRDSFTNVAVCATNDVNRHSSHHAARFGIDCQNSFPASTADDVNRRYSHHNTSSSVANHGGIPSNNKLKNGSSLPSSTRSSHPNTSSSNHAFSHPTSSSDIVNHGALHPTSSSNELISHGSLQPATSQGCDTDFENSRSDLSNRSYGGDEPTNSQPCMAGSSFPHHRKFNINHMIPPSNVGSTLHTGLQGKLASRKLANTSSKLCESRGAAPGGIARVRETYTKSRAGIKGPATGHRPNELCKDCKASLMESVCFIANDGRISAVRTGAYARHFHHCNVSGCAANRSYHPSLSLLSKNDSCSKRQAPHNPQPTRTKSHTLCSIGDRRRSTASSIQGEDCSNQEMELSLSGSIEMSSTTGSEIHDIKQELTLKETSHNNFAMKCSEQGDESHEDTDSLCRASIDQNGLDVVSHCSYSPSMQVSKDQESYGENSQVENVEVHSSPAASCISSDIHDDDDEKDSVYRDDIQALNDFKSLFYHGDNEYSCSEDGTEATTTPNSLIKGAFDDLSNIDIEQSSSKNNESQPRRSRMAWMRQKYLESLREQEAETVRLRKQEIMARKQAGDWMLDCHMEEVLHKLAPNGEVRVKVLVEAFETVIQHSDSEMANHQDQDHLENLHSYATS